MRCLIVSDVHSNLEAFESVLSDAEKRGGFDELWSVGDVVGYGPDPVACIDLMMQHNAKGVAGNHDYACDGKMSTEDFNPHAAAAVAWTRKQLALEQTSYLHDLPLKIEISGFTIVHGSPRDPLREYLITSQVALDNYPHFDTPRCIVGHSHRAFVCRPRGDNAIFEEFPLDSPIALDSDRLIFNPGAVGQPRDRDPRASYAIYDSTAETMTHHRAEYDVSLTQSKMSTQQLPRFLVERIAYGL